MIPGGLGGDQRERIERCSVGGCVVPVVGGRGAPARRVPECPPDPLASATWTDCSSRFVGPGSSPLPCVLPTLLCDAGVMPDADRPPTGTVTFLFTDVEGSTRLWAADEAAMSASLLLHDSIVREAIESVGGFVFTTAGDSFSAMFGPPRMRCWLRRRRKRRSQASSGLDRRYESGRDCTWARSRSATETISVRPRRRCGDDPQALGCRPVGDVDGRGRLGQDEACSSGRRVRTGPTIWWRLVRRFHRRAGRVRVARGDRRLRRTPSDSPSQRPPTSASSILPSMGGRCRIPGPADLRNSSPKHSVIWTSLEPMPPNATPNSPPWRSGPATGRIG